MNRELKVLPKADQDIDGHFNYIVEDSLDAAVRFYDAVYATFDTLLLRPFIGKAKVYRKPELSGLRMWFVKGFEHYLIFYRVGEETLEIVRILHSSRDIEKALTEDEKTE
ncbi:MAG: plasmid stabilization system protein [bacterium]|nr:MAG: plasmid stabilization system protein [bacterium]